MRNHDEKTRDMARSILPSKARAGARFAKKQSASRVRARNNARLRRLTRHIAAGHDVADFDEPLDHYQADLHSFEWGRSSDWMIRRRGADKISPVMRWAEARIDQDPDLAGAAPDARRAHFAAVLGQTKAGRHALSHLEDVIGAENPTEYGGAMTWKEILQIRQDRRDEYRETRHRHLDRLNNVLAGADANRLNRRICVLTPPIEENYELRWVDDELRRVHVGTSGHQPWLYTGDPDAWVDGPERVRGRSERHEIALEALRQVHAEMFGRDHHE